MPGVALIAHFDGDPNDLTRRLHMVASRYAITHEAPQPATALLLRNKEGITLVLAWPEGSSLGPFRTFLTSAIGELGLSRPRTEHFRAEAIAWDAVARRD